MSTEENKAIQRRIIEEIFNKHDLAVVEELLDTNWVYHGPTGMPEFKGPEGMRQLATMCFTAFPDWHETIDDIVAEGDRVACRTTIRGTHQGDFMGTAPTGKKIAVQAMGIDRFAGGKAVELWLSIDSAGMMRQLGVIPPRR
jgi:predicted ester cyclase